MGRRASGRMLSMEKPNSKMRRTIPWFISIPLVLLVVVFLGIFFAFQMAREVMVDVQKYAEEYSRKMLAKPPLEIFNQFVCRKTPGSVESVNLLYFDKGADTSDAIAMEFNINEQDFMALVKRHEFISTNYIQGGGPRMPSFRHVPERADKAGYIVFEDERESAFLWFNPNTNHAVFQHWWLNTCEENARKP